MSNKPVEHSLMAPVIDTLLLPNRPPSPPEFEDLRIEQIEFNQTNVEDVRNVLLKTGVKAHCAVEFASKQVMDT